MLIKLLVLKQYYLMINKINKRKNYPLETILEKAIINLIRTCNLVTMG